MIDIYVDIDPVGKGRPRFTRAGHTYTPPATKDAEKEIAKKWKSERPYLFFEKGVPLILSVVAYFPIPPSWGKHKTRAAAEGELFPTKRPDGDNILKLVADALNGVAYEDDAQIVSMAVRKVYTGGAGCIKVSIGEYK